MPAICHTITREEFSHCAFTGKVLRFAPMMRSRGYEVYHYGVETSESGATKDIQLMTKAEWSDLRVKSYKMLHPEMAEAAIVEKLNDPKSMVGDLANFDTPLWVEFQKRLHEQLKVHYRSPKTDIFCIPMNPYKAMDGLTMTVVESGIGYPNSSQQFRIFESYAWMHAHLGKGNGNNYWFVVPNYFDSHDWPLSLTPTVNTVGFLGRIYDGKGCHEIVEIAKRLPTIRFVLCGQGNPTQYLKHPNIFYKPPIHGKERAEYLGSLVACVAPTMFVEPFCGVAVEAQLCGTPVVTKDYGAQTDTVENFKTGLRCHTLADYVHGIQMALDGKFDRAYIRERAVSLYDMYNVARQYDYTFKTILDVNNGNNGWYSKESHIELLSGEDHMKKQRTSDCFERIGAILSEERPEERSEARPPEHPIATLGICGPFAINLSHRVDRWDRIQKSAKDVGLEIVRIEAVYDKHDGASGCLASHIQALESGKGGNAVWVCEDDCVFIVDKQTIDTYVTKFMESDADVLCLGFADRKNVSYSTDFMRTYDCQAVSSYIVKEKVRVKLIELWKSVLECRKTRTIHPLESVYKSLKILNPEFLRRDQSWKIMQQEHVFLIPRIRCAIQGESHSDIVHEVVNYKC